MNSKNICCIIDSFSEYGYGTTHKTINSPKNPTKITTELHNNKDEGTSSNNFLILFDLISFLEIVLEISFILIAEIKLISDKIIVCAASFCQGKMISDFNYFAFIKNNDLIG